MDLSEILDVLRELRLPWAYAGAVAANRYRLTARHTGDVDILVAFEPTLTAVLSERSWDLTVAADPGSAPYLIRARKHLSVDFIVANTEYQDVALRRATEHYLTVEDVIVHKLIAGRPRDVDDIRSIVAAGREVDTGYIKEWAEAWVVSDLWRELADGRTDGQTDG